MDNTLKPSSFIIIKVVVYRKVFYFIQKFFLIFLAFLFIKKLFAVFCNINGLLNCFFFHVTIKFCVYYATSNPAIRQSSSITSESLPPLYDNSTSLSLHVDFSNFKAISTFIRKLSVISRLLSAIYNSLASSYNYPNPNRIADVGVREYTVFSC